MPELLLQFGMTGALSWAEAGEERHPRDRVIFVCGGGELRYNNMRRFGGVWLARDEDERPASHRPAGAGRRTHHADEFEAQRDARCPRCATALQRATDRMRVPALPGEMMTSYDAASRWRMPTRSW